MTRSRTWINIRLMVQFLFKWRIQILTLTVTSYIQSTLVPVSFYERSTICYTNLKSMNKLISRWYITIILQEKNTGSNLDEKVEDIRNQLFSSTENYVKDPVVEEKKAWSKSDEKVEDIRSQLMGPIDDYEIQPVTEKDNGEPEHIYLIKVIPLYLSLYFWKFLKEGSDDTLMIFHLLIIYM